MLLASDSGLEGYAGQVIVTDNDIEIDAGDAALALGSTGPVALLNGTQITNNRIIGAAEYAVIADNGAQNCNIVDNDLTGFEAGKADIGLYGSETNYNTVSGESGTVDTGSGAFLNMVTGFTALPSSDTTP